MHRVPRTRDLEQRWRSYASAKRFGFAPAAGSWPHARTPRIDARVGDVALVIEACSLTIEREPRPCTRVSGRALEPVALRVLVSSDARLMQGPGVHELEHTVQDGTLQVRATSAGAVGRCLGVPLDPRAVDLLASGVLQYDEGEVSLTWLGEETRASVLDEACAVVACTCAAAGSSVAYR